MNRIVNKDIYNRAYVMMTSSLEDYFNKIMKLLSIYDNNRVKYHMNGIKIRNKYN